ncbi:MAG: 4-diphosphocytidyl-2-C-methyl-D-erythritol kinase [Actinomycetota bacterium]
MTSAIAPAKLTLSLRVTGVRADGFHLIDAEMVSLDIADELIITDATSTTIVVTGPYADGVPTDETNIVHKALALCGRTAHVSIVKNIPHGGGLGGGSTDAAAVLRWAQFTDVGASATVGADVPFCLVGGRAQVKGIGEIIEPLPFEEKKITLFIPPIHVSTPAVYQSWDGLGGPKGANGNDLEPAALHAYPELQTWKNSIEDAIQQKAFLAGSGATWFALGHTQLDSARLAGVQVVYASTRPG